MKIRFGVWRNWKDTTHTTTRTRENKTGEFIIRKADWNDDKTHQKIKDKIRKLYPGWYIEGYVNLSYKDNQK